MRDGDEAGDQTDPPAESTPTERGWHSVPGNPNYQRFWDGQKWGEQRYWGGAGKTDRSGPTETSTPSATPDPEPEPKPHLDPLAQERTPPLDAPIRYQQGLFGAPLSPRSPTRRGAVVALSVILIFVYYSLHLFPTKLLLIFIALGVIATLVQLPPRLRYLRDPARRAAIREPITFQSKVWLQFKYAPTRLPYFQFGRWDLAVRTDSFQVTNWIFGSRDRARSTFFSADEAQMWQKSVDGRDCIVVSGPTYNRSKVEFAFSADEGNAEAWAALTAAGVRGVPMPVSDRFGTPTTTFSTDPGTPSGAPPTPDAPRGFQRVGSDLGTVHTASPNPNPNPTAPQDPAPPDPSANTSRFGGNRRSAPIRAGQWTPGIIIGAVAFVLLGPLLLATIARVAFVPDSKNTNPTATSSVVTTQCMHFPDSTAVKWSGHVARTPALVTQGHVVLFIEAVTPGQTELGGTRQELPIPPDALSVIPLGPVDFTLPTATSEQVSCQASFASPNGIG